MPISLLIIDDRVRDANDYHQVRSGWEDCPSDERAVRYGITVVTHAPMTPRNPSLNRRLLYADTCRGP